MSYHTGLAKVLNGQSTCEAPVFQKRLDNPALIRIDFVSRTDCKFVEEMEYQHRVGELRPKCLRIGIWAGLHASTCRRDREDE